jgi:hypothetical protein
MSIIKTKKNFIKKQTTKSKSLDIKHETSKLALPQGVIDFLT